MTETAETLDLQAALAENDPNAFVRAVMGSEGKSVQMANVAAALEKARASTDPKLTQFADQLEAALAQTAGAERMELDAAAAAAGQDQQQMDLLGGIFTQMMGPDGKFQFSDLMNIFTLDWGAIIGQLIGSLTSGFNGAATADPETIAAQHEAAGQTLDDAMSTLNGIDGEEADFIRQRLGGDQATKVQEQIKGIVPAPPAPAPGG